MSVTDPETDFTQLMSDFQGRLYAFILSVVWNPDAANDILQETNLVLWQKSEEFQPGTSFKAWSFRVASFQVMAWRRDRRRENNRMVYDDALLNEIVEQARESDKDYPDRKLALRTCIKKLNSRQRELITRRYLTGVTIEELAESANQSQQTIVQVLYRARRNLMSCIRLNTPAEATS